MPLDWIGVTAEVTPLALPAYEEAYVTELFNSLLPAAIAAGNEYVYARTRWQWQTQMKFLVEGGTADPVMPTYEKAYVAEHYDSLKGGALAEQAEYILSRTPWYWQEAMTLRVGGATTAASVGDAWQAGVIANGGSISAARLSIAKQFIAAEVISGAWDLTDEYWVLWAENAAQALTPLKRRLLVTAVAAPVFTVDRDYTFNGTSNYLNTNWVPSTHAVAMTGTNLRIAAYERVNAIAPAYTAGSETSVTVSLTLMGSFFGSMTASLGHNAVQVALPAPQTSAGFGAASRAAGGTTVRCYKTGVALAPATAVTPGTTLPAQPLYIGCRNNNGAADGFAMRSIGLVCVGAPLSAAQELAQYQNVQRWATAVGANV